MAAPPLDSTTASGASTHGTVTILEWWSDSGTARFHYTDGWVHKCLVGDAFTRVIALLGRKDRIRRSAVANEAVRRPIQRHPSTSPFNVTLPGQPANCQSDDGGLGGDAWR